MDSHSLKVRLGIRVLKWTVSGQGRSAVPRRGAKPPPRPQVIEIINWLLCLVLRQTGYAPTAEHLSQANRAHALPAPSVPTRQPHIIGDRTIESWGASSLPREEVYWGIHSIIPTGLVQAKNGVSVATKMSVFGLGWVVGVDVGLGGGALQEMSSGTTHIHKYSIG